MAEGIWNEHVSKKQIIINSMYCSYGRSKVLIEQRQMKYQKQFEKIRNDIIEYLMKRASILIDTNKIMIILKDFINKQQYQLRIVFEERRHQLKFDVKDHQLERYFYK